jgi:putative ABC transport system ATP-binding protein
MTALVEVKNLTKTYGQKNEQKYQALKGISFNVERGEFVAIMGASGSGKTTLLNMLSTLDRPSSGQVKINGTDITKLKKNKLADFRGRQIGFIFQDFNLLDNLTNQENIALPLALQNTKAAVIKEQVERLAQHLGIGQILSKYPVEVSGGQKQRVAAARALIHHPQIIFGDEPTGALDSVAARELLTTLAKLNQEEQTAILMVTHDSFSASYAQRILFIKDGQIGRELRRGQLSQTEFHQEIIKEIARQ